ncbi:MAG: hypothetical protein GY795_30440 [Desulfobacterales bacterium]|nr:hypothetical protein [Desulfobacterales bacterium]
MIIITFLFLLLIGSILNIFFIRKQAKKKKDIFKQWSKYGIIFVIISVCITVPMNYIFFVIKKERVNQIEIGDSKLKVKQLLGIPDQIDDDPQFLRTYKKISDLKWITDLIGKDDLKTSAYDFEYYSFFLDYTTWNGFLFYPICSGFVAHSRYDITIRFGENDKVTQIWTGGNNQIK